MPSLGAAMADSLIAIGISTPDRLRALGAEEAWRRLRFAHGRRITITWIYAFDIAVRGAAWSTLTEARTRRLRAAAERIRDDLEGKTRPTKRSPKAAKRV